MEQTTTPVLEVTRSAQATNTGAARSFAQQTPGEQLFSIAIFGLGAVASGAFAYYLIANPARLTEVWAWTRTLPLWAQAVIWLLFLPWMIALWIWTLPWAAPIRLVLVVGTLLWTTWLLYPWK